MFLKIVILLNGFLFLYEIGFTSFFLIHPFENLKNFPLIPITLIFDPKVISFIFFLLLGNL